MMQSRSAAWYLIACLIQISKSCGSCVKMDANVQSYDLTVQQIVNLYRQGKVSNGQVRRALEQRLGWYSIQENLFWYHERRQCANGVRMCVLENNIDEASVRSESEIEDASSAASDEDANAHICRFEDLFNDATADSISLVRLSNKGKHFIGGVQSQKRWTKEEVHQQVASYFFDHLSSKTDSSMLTEYLTAEASMFPQAWAWNIGPVKLREKEQQMPDVLRSAQYLIAT
jgi:hypothetical protein